MGAAARYLLMTNRYPQVSADEIGWLTEAQMIEVDRIMIEDLRIELIQMMENAGSNLAELVIELYAPESVAVLAGSGGNGGGGLVAARHLSNRGVDVTASVALPWTGCRADRVERGKWRAGRVPRHSIGAERNRGVRPWCCRQRRRDPHPGTSEAGASREWVGRGAVRGRYLRAVGCVRGSGRRARSCVRW
jgi:hypothetical protein